jgi:hypothetical protein
LLIIRRRLRSLRHVDAIMGTDTPTCAHANIIIALHIGSMTSAVTTRIIITARIITATRTFAAANEERLVSFE